jgi:hypothetical protein
MTELASLPLAAWQNFYVIVGSSGGALIGLQFVAIALIAETRTRATADSIRAFGTSNVVHLGSALFISAIMSAPWPSLFPISVILKVCGLAGLGYGVLVAHRARRQKEYKVVWEDWLWFVVWPSIIYAALFYGAFLLRTSTGRPMFAIAATALALLVIGIHNAWDTVTYIVISSSQSNSKKTK